MAIVGFNYSKISGEQMKPFKGTVNINNNVTINKAEEGKMKLEKGKKSMMVGFKYTSNYQPDIAKIEIEGNLIVLDEEKKVDELLKQWDKEKKLPKDVMTDLINNVLAKCNVQALIMSRDLNIPSPIPMPKVSGEGAKPSKKK